MVVVVLGRSVYGKVVGFKVALILLPFFLPNISSSC
jgi:hypothetical protein